MKKKNTKQILCSFLLLGFLLGVHNGRVALWKGQDPQPMRVYPCPVCVLPRKDQQALRNGTRIDSMEDLDRFLENFLS
jgi:hypothetical protein